MGFKQTHRSKIWPECLPHGEKTQPVELGPADRSIDGHNQVPTGCAHKSKILPECLPYGEEAQPVELGPADRSIDGHNQVQDVQLILQYKLPPSKKKPVTPIKR